jgi:uncharacterized membrane protein YeaQ/YmgE (transglycosylase-associated protein family)
MIVLFWIAFGLIAGLIAGKRFHHSGTALALDMGVTVLGAVAGAFAANSLGAMQPAAFITFGLFGAAVGSVAALFGYRAIFHSA